MPGRFLNANPLSIKTRIRNWQILLTHGISLWYPFEKSYSDFSGAATATAITLFQLPPAGVIEACKIKHSVAFTGGGASAVVIELGTAVDPNKYAGQFDVFQATGSTAYHVVNRIGGESHSIETAIPVKLSADVNLDQLTAGKVEIWVKFGIVK